MAANLQSMNLYWKNFDLQDLQKNLDTTATELAGRQDDSDISRKKLVEQSRDFKKNTPEDIRKVVAPLLKSFQGEIDALSKRSKAAEAAFLNVYKKLIDVPDPVPALEFAQGIQKKAQKVQDLEIENTKLRETLAEYNAEFADVKNQEVTIKSLKDKLKEHEEKLEQTIQGRTKEKEKQLQRSFAEKEHQLQETQLSVAKQLGESEQKVSTLQSALDSVQSELFDLKSKYDETSSAKSDEMEIVMSDLERANERAAASERQVEQLRQQLSSATQNLNQAEQMSKAPDMEQAIDILKRSSLEVELAAKEKEISQLVDDVQRLQSSLNKLRETTSTQIANLEEELTQKTQALKTIEERMKGQEDYEETKRELNILKSIEFPSKNSEAAPDSAAIKKSLEMLLLEKNKALQTEATQLKLANRDVTGGDGSPAPNPNDPMSSTEVYASMIGQELVTSYQQAILANGGTPRSDSSSESKPSPPIKTEPVRTNGVLPDSEFFRERNGHLSPTEIAALNQRKLSTRERESLDCSNGPMLDTSEVALRIRDILSSHNIGQRLFAKHVLGLSQGTVSELLSKPKHWDKLTEKGRESYRKMYQWSCDDANINELKAISPKKGATPIVSNYNKTEDHETEVRIQEILLDARQAMQSKQQQEQGQVTTAMVSNIYQRELAKISGHSQQSSPASSSEHRRSSKDRERSRTEAAIRQNQESECKISEQIVQRIYEEELMKLAGAAQQAGNIAEFTMYQQELARLARHHDLSHSGSSSSVNKDFLNGLKIKSEPDSSNSPNPLNGTPISGSSIYAKHEEALRHAGSAFFLVRPQGGIPSPFDPSQYPPTSFADGVSPLQRMQSIANSLMSKAQNAVPLQRPLKAVLPPISQEQFDRYTNLNTDDVVKKIKDCLSQFSISQRLFGENILGLSQGSVSDLLARPKPWNMLTQKGREPFIRMQLFLEDQESIPKLVSNQYKISPDKLMRNNSFSLPTPTQDPDSPQDLSNHKSSSKPSTPSIVEPVKRERQPSIANSDSSDPAFKPSVFEVAAMTAELDTLAITSKVREVLQFHNLGQKLFGEAILGLSQGSVSELLSKPKPWPMLSLKGREPFIKMHMWLTDPHNIDRLRLYQTELRAHRSRKRSSDDSIDFSPSNNKKQRVFFTEEQKDSLRQAYNSDPYPNQTTIEVLAAQLGVTPKTVINWFHNHRMRAKQQIHITNGVKVESNDESNCSDSVTSERSFPMEPTQWMFPTFEAVPSGRLSQNSSISDTPTDLRVKHNDTPDALISTPQGMNLPVDLKPPTGVNKRKSSHPQWVFQGLSLDRSITDTTDSPDSTSTSPPEHTANSNNENDSTKEVLLNDDTVSNHGDQLTTNIQDSHNNNKDDKAPESVNSGSMVNGDCRDSDNEESIERMEFSNKSNQGGNPLIEKMQKRLDTNEIIWDEVNREENIEKLQNNIQTAETEEDWEF